MMSNQQGIRCVALLGIGLLLAGCGDSEQQDLDLVLQDIYSGVPFEKMTPPKALERTGRLLFVAAPLRNPFMTPQMEVAGDRGFDCAQPNTERKKTALEQYGLEKLKFRGVIGDKAQLWALIETPDAELVRIGTGDYIGLNWGSINKVSASAIELNEMVSDGRGCWQQRQVALALDTSPFGS
ncbi:pilus assembly protein PilP [Plesiomonas sp.]|uniref:pilus assembly protein PilP n=1 Tax=Plesiomonas sp. TaxID=2486279 RepID=UPI003F3D60D5